MSELLQGNVTVNKRLRRHPVWLREPFSYGQAWVDLLLLANDAPRTATVHGESFVMERGQLCWSQRALEREWNRSGEWVKRFLTFCQDEAMLKMDATPRRTIISILNYDAYNTLSTVTEPETDTDAGTVTEPGRNLETGRGKGNLERGTRAGDFSEAPEEAEILEFAGSWTGDTARAIPAGAMTEAWALEWMSWQKTWLADWRRRMVQRFVSEWITCRPLARLILEKNGAPAPGLLKRERGEILQELELAKKNGAATGQLEKELTNS